MKIRRLLVGALMATAAVALVPAPAGAVSCLPPETEPLAGRNCWDCGWVMIQGKPHTLFYCD